MPNPLACSGCKFFERLTDTHGIESGKCRAVPPVVVASSQRTETTAWPVVGADDWCGAFQPITD